MAFEIIDPRGFLFLVLFAIPIVASRNIDCHGRGFHCVNSTHFMICVDLGIGISTTIDDFIIPCPLTTVCDVNNMFECEFPRVEVTAPPLQVIGVFEQSVTSEATVVSTSATSVPLIEVSSVSNKPVSILSGPEEITPAPELEVLRRVKEYTEAYSDTSTKLEVTAQTTPSSVSEIVKLDGIAALVTNAVNNYTELNAETSLDKTVASPDTPISIDKTTSATEILNSTSILAPEVSTDSVVENSYQNENILNNTQKDYNKTLNQNDTGLNLIGESITTDKIQISSTSALPNITLSVENMPGSTETVLRMAEENVTKTTEMTPTSVDVTDSIIADTSSVTPLVNTLRRTDKLVDSDQVLKTVTNLVKQVEPTTSTSPNLSTGFTTIPYVKFEISHTVVNVTTNAANNDTSSTTVSLNISGIIENHSDLNNVLTTPTFKNDLPPSLTGKHIQDQIKLNVLPINSTIPQKVIVQNDLKYNNTYVPKNNIYGNKPNVTQRIPDNVDQLSQLVQDKVTATAIDFNNIEIIPNSPVIGNETKETKVGNFISNATDSLYPLAFTNNITNIVVEPKTIKSTTITSNFDANNLNSTNLENLLTFISTKGRTIENATDFSSETIQNKNISITDFKEENNITKQLTENNEAELLTNPGETNIRHRAFELSNQVTKTVEELNINDLTDASLNYTDPVKAINSSITKVPELNRTQDEVNKTNSVIVKNISVHEPTIEVNAGEHTIPELRTTDIIKDLELNNALNQTSSNGTVLLNMTDKPILEDNTNILTVKYDTKENSTAIEITTEVPINETTRTDSGKVLKVYDSSTTVEYTTHSVGLRDNTNTTTVQHDTQDDNTVSGKTPEVPILNNILNVTTQTDSSNVHNVNESSTTVNNNTPISLRDNTNTTTEQHNTQENSTTIDGTTPEVSILNNISNITTQTDSSNVQNVNESSTTVNNNTPISLRDNTNTTTVQYDTQENNTVSGKTPEVSILNSIININTQIDSSDVLKVNESGAAVNNNTTVSLRDNTNITTVNYDTKEINTVTEIPPEVPILKNIINMTTQTESNNFLRANESSIIVDSTTPISLIHNINITTVNYDTKEINTVTEKPPEVQILKNITNISTQIESNNVLRANESGITVDNTTPISLRDNTNIAAIKQDTKEINTVTEKTLEVPILKNIINMKTQIKSSNDLRVNETSTTVDNTTPISLRDNTNITTVNYDTKEINTVTEKTLEVPIQTNIINMATQIKSNNVLRVNESSTTVDDTATSATSLASTTSSTIGNEERFANYVNILLETTMKPESKNEMHTPLDEIKTSSSATGILVAVPDFISESTLETVGTTDASRTIVLRETELAENNQTNNINPNNGPSESGVDFNKTKTIEELARASQVIEKQTGPCTQIESTTSSPSVTSLPEIQSTTESIAKNSSNKLTDNLTQTEDNVTTIARNTFATNESKLFSTDANEATTFNENNSSYTTISVVTPSLDIVESTISVTSSPITTTQIHQEEVTTTTEKLQTKATPSPQNAARTIVVSKIKDINETSSILLRDRINSTVTQDPETTTVKMTTVNNTTLRQTPISSLVKEYLPSTPFAEEVEKLRSVANTITTASTNDNVTLILSDNNSNDLTPLDLKMATNLDSKNISIVKQEIFVPFQDVMGDNAVQSINTTPIMKYEEVKLNNVNGNVKLKQQPLIKKVPERNTLVYDVSNLTPVVAFLTPTVKMSDASFIYIIPSVRRIDPFDRRSKSIYNTSLRSKVATQPGLNSVTAPDSMVETIKVNGGKTIKTSHLGLVLNQTGIKNETLDLIAGHKSANHIDREHIEATNDGNINANKTIETLSNTDVASSIRKVIPDIQNEGLPAKSPIDVNLAQGSSINTVEYEKMSSTTNMPHVSKEKESSEIIISANNNVTFVKTSITNVSQDFETGNKLKTSTTSNNQKVNLAEHNQTQRNVTGNELKHNTTKKSDFEQTVTNKQLHASNKDKNNTNATAGTFNCSNHTRGKYADKKDCRKFYTCVGNLQPLIGICPNNTVFSDLNKQCTRNLSHCVRNNQFRCLHEGRFNDFYKDNVYYICVKNTKNQFVRYKFQCHSDYHLNKATVKCEKNVINSTRSATSGSENSRVMNDEMPSAIERESSRKMYNTKFECEDEGSFSHSNDCNKYYECTKVKDVYRRKLKKCAVDEVYDKDKKKCIKSDSSEC
ncbi:unnamed protein product [Chrysodeixis includens]|uniref:Chitin-binding type-2 domain-containing protein n=1 Tax=Chrysodeixis includens TaxID=689277 RepID=A0A9P0G1D2_CHRIL|nr:unnamed protein product [Chrysodeixis includens]